MFKTRRLLKFMAQQKHLSFSTTFVQGNMVAELLENRGLLRVSGAESSAYLQGLITNDMTHLDTGSNTMYTMFLNSKGRVIYDAIIYRTSEPHTLFIECDSSALPGLERHLKMYRLRKNVIIDAVTDFKVWCVFHPLCEPVNVNLAENIKNRIYRQSSSCNETSTPSQNHNANDGNIFVFRDPRIAELGLRVLCPSSDDISNMLQVAQGISYRTLRYHLGVGEGIIDLPPDHCFPLEANCDYLHGVSFHKGCYIGQELTARTHHTGVVRKRLMPIFLEKPVNESNACKQEVVNEKQKVVGKVRCLDGMVGLGLLRVSEVLSAEDLFVGSTRIQTKRPSWWPREAPKEVESRSKP